MANIQWQPVHKFSQPGIENIDHNLGEMPWWTTKFSQGTLIEMREEN